MEENADVTPTAAEIQGWIVARVGRLANLPEAEVDPHAPLTRFGLDSVAVIALAADLEKWLNFRFRENPVGANTTIESLSRYLAGEVARQRLG